MGEVKTGSKGLSRREFMLMAFFEGLSIVTATSASLKKLNNEVVGIVWENFPNIIQDEYKVDMFLWLAVPELVNAAKKKDPDLAKDLQDNPSRKPLSRLIDLGIKEYGKNIFFKTSEPFLTEQQFAEILESGKDSLSDEAKKITVQDLITWLKGEGNVDDENMKRIQEFLAAVKDYAYMQRTEIWAGDDYWGTSELFKFDPDSGIAKRSLENDSSNPEQYALDDLNETWDYLKRLYSESGNRVSTSRILAHYLEKNTGDLGLAIYDTAIFLKVLARNDFVDLSYIADKPERQQEVCERFSMIKDEFSLIGKDFGLPIVQQTGLYDDTENKDKSMINQVGLAYHQWFITALLMKMDRVPIKVSTIGSQLLEINTAQGRTKTASDFQTLLELEDTDRYIKSFAVS